jgi:pimeloyl-ACP methyl ester carboxylesterase
MPIIKVNDINMYYEIHGEGEPLLLIMGMGADLSVWGDNIQRLAEKYQVIAFDNRGAGRTDKPDIPYSIEMMAEDTIGLMDWLNIKRAHIIGASMGSLIAQRIAAYHPERIKSLILYVSFARIARGFLQNIFSMLWPVVLKMPGVKEKMCLCKYLPTDRSLLRQTEAVSRFDSQSWLHRIKVPTLIVNGTKDFFAGPKYTKELTSGIADARLILFKGGHFGAAENLELFINSALEFLYEVDALAQNA